MDADVAEWQSIPSEEMFAISSWKQIGSPRPICSSVVVVDDMWAPVESKVDFSSGVMLLQCDSKISGPSRPYCVTGPTASKADWIFCQP
jgi:hypothetical protein